MADYEPYMDEARRIVSASKAYGIGNNADSLKTFATNYRKDPRTYDETANVLSFMRDTYGSKANKLDAAGMSNVFKQYRYYQDRSKAGKEPLTIADAGWDPTAHDDDYNTVLAGWYHSNKAMPESWQESEFNSQLNAYRKEIADAQAKAAAQTAKEAADQRSKGYESRGYAYASGEDRTQAPGSYAVTQRIVDEANDFNAKAHKVLQNGGTVADVRKLYAGYPMLTQVNTIENYYNLGGSNGIAAQEAKLSNNSTSQSDAYNRAMLVKMGILGDNGTGTLGLLDSIVSKKQQDFAQALRSGGPISVVPGMRFWNAGNTEGQANAAATDQNALALLDLTGKYSGQASPTTTPSPTAQPAQQQMPEASSVLALLKIGLTPNGQGALFQYQPQAQSESNKYASNYLPEQLIPKGTPVQADQQPVQQPISTPTKHTGADARDMLNRALQRESDAYAARTELFNPLPMVSSAARNLSAAGVDLIAGKPVTFSPNMTGADYTAKLAADTGAIDLQKTLSGLFTSDNARMRIAKILGYDDAKTDEQKAVIMNMADGLANTLGWGVQQPYELATDPTSYIGVGEAKMIANGGKAFKIGDASYETALQSGKLLENGQKTLAKVTQNTDPRRVDPEDLVPTRAERLAAEEDPLAALRTTTPEPTLPRADADALPVSPDMPRSKIEISPIASGRSTNGTNLSGTGSGDISESIISQNADVMQAPTEDPLAALRRDVPEPTLPNASAEALYTPEQRAAVATSKTTAGTGGKAAVSRGNIRSSILELADTGKLEPKSTILDADTQNIMRTYAQRDRLQGQKDYIKERYGITARDEDWLADVDKGKITFQEAASRTQVSPEQLTDYYNVSRELDATKAEISQYVKSERSALHQRADSVTANSDTWKDPARIRQNLETPERNFEAVMGDDAPGMIREYLEPVHTNEAISNNWKNGWRKTIADLNLSKEESKIVQQVGEGKVKLEDVAGLTQEQSAKVQNAVDTFRKFYDETFDKLNAKLVQNGYEPVKKRANYFPHFMDEDSFLANLKRAIGWNSKAQELPTEISNLTSTFKPGKTWFGNLLSRKGSATTFDAVKGFDQYIEGASNVIYHTDDIQRLRALGTSLRQKYSDEGIDAAIAAAKREYTDPLEQANKIKEIVETGPTKLTNFVAWLDDYTNGLAGKKSIFSRSSESKWGRTIYTAANALTNQIGKNMVAVNPGSWAAQFVPLTQGLATVRGTNAMRALRDTVQAAVIDDGFRSVSSFLTNRRGTSSIAKNALDKASDFMSKPMRWVDDFASETITRAKYYDNLQNGMDAEAAMRSADDYAARVIADRSRGATPTMFNANDAGTKAMTQFQLEVNNQLSFLLKDLPKEFQEKGASYAAGVIGKLAVFGYLFNEGYEALTGRRIAVDPIGGALGIYEGTTGNRLSWAHPEDWIKGTKDLTATMERDDLGNLDTAANLGASLGEAGKDLLNNVPFAAAPAGLFGLTDVGRLPISAAIPNVKNMTNPQNTAKELAKPAAYVLPPFGGGQIKKSVESGLMLHSGGEYATDANGEQRLKFPSPDQPFDMAQAVLFGKYSTPQGRGYVERGFQGLEPADTKRYQELTEAGLPREVTFDALLGIKNVTKQDGATWEKSQRVAAYVNGLEELTAAQKQQLIQEALVGGSPNETTRKRTAALRTAGMSDSRIRAVLAGVAQITPANGKTVEVGDIRKWLQQQRVMGFLNQADFEAAYRVLGSSGGTAPTN